MNIPLLANYVMIEGEANQNFPSFLSPIKICFENSNIPVLNVKSNGETEIVLIEVEHLTAVKFIINELINKEGFEKLLSIDFKKAKLNFEFIQKTNTNTRIQIEEWLEFYTNDNNVYIGKLNGKSINKEIGKRNRKISLNKLSDFHELDEEE